MERLVAVADHPPVGHTQPGDGGPAPARRQQERLVALTAIGLRLFRVVVLVRPAIAKRDRAICRGFQLEHFR